MDVQIAPERIVVDHRNGKTTFSAMGVSDMTKAFRHSYVRSDIADRSTQTHNHEFAEIKNIYDSLPHRFEAEAWATNPDTMRKHALIQKGWCDVLSFYYPDQKVASELAPKEKQTLVKYHGYVLGAGTVSEGGGFVVVFKVPHSQSKSAMGAAAFQQSKSDVLEWCADMLQLNDDMNVAGTG